jgi:tetratricopeptide repeat protein 30
MATIAQSISMNAHGGQARVGEGNKTQAVYTLISEQKYNEAIKLLTAELTAHPKSRAALSLLGHCYYYVQDFPNCVQVYEQLARLVPESVEYRVYLAQCYFKAGMYNEATKAALSVDSSDPAIKQRVRR